MKYILTAALLTTAAFSAFGDESSSYTFEKVAETISPRNIQILLAKDATEALLEVTGPYYLFNPHDGSRVASGLLGKRFMIHELETGLKWGTEFAGIHQIYIQPRSPETAIFVNGIQQSGAVAVYGVAGRIHIVNDLDIESYVKSVLANQFPAPLEPEVLASLAILARTDAYYHATQNSDTFWHVSAQEIGFTGAPLIVASSPIEKAVGSTKHLILVHPENGKILPFATAWTANSAGKTAAFEAIFRKEGFAPDKGVDAPHAALVREESKWTHSLSKKHLAHLLGLVEIKSVETFVDAPSGKVYGLRIKDKSDTHDLDFLALQEKLGKHHLLSSDFSVTVKDETVQFTGYGEGHGVGLCLYSASALAQNGESAVKILAKFFPETYLYNINALPGGE